jgi:hypothetical protein
MTFELVRGSGNRHLPSVRIDNRNADAQLWWCERKQEWHWCLIWEDGTSWGTHMHNGIAPTKERARADIVKAIIWTEDTWPRIEYFDNNS